MTVLVIVFSTIATLALTLGYFVLRGQKRMRSHLLALIGIYGIVQAIGFLSVCLMALGSGEVLCHNWWTGDAYLCAPVEIVLQELIRYTLFGPALSLVALFAAVGLALSPVGDACMRQRIEVVD